MWSVALQASCYFTGLWGLALRRVKRAEAKGGFAVHTQGGAHTRQSVATAGVLLFKGVAGAGPHVE